MMSSATVVLLTLSSLGMSHMIMRTPTPFAASKLAGNNGPLLPDGSDFPCKFGYDTEGASNTMPLGSKQELAFTGGATHGGGSCQVSITYDKAPTASSTFKVIHSIVGGCPARNTAGNIGNSATFDDPDKYSFTIPQDLPAGDAVLAWTWFNKVGNREMYMNCAPVKLTGGDIAERELQSNATEIIKRGAAFDALPDMFVANIGNGCTTKDSTDLQFEEPGQSVEILSDKALAGPSGSCAKSKNGGAPKESNPGSDSGSGNGSDSGNVGSGNGSESGNGKGSGSGKGNGNGKGSGKGSGNVSPDASKPQNPTPASGGSFYTKEPSKPDTAPNAGKPNNSSSPSKPSPPQTTGSSGSMAAGTPCSNEGTWNCVGGKSYQQCASGTWSVIMPMAAGTECKSGMSAALKMHAVQSRHVRFSNAHLRRHIHNIKFH